MAPPLVPVPLPEPGLPVPLLPAGAPGVLSGGFGVLLLTSGLLVEVPELSFAAKLAAEAVASRPASNKEVRVRVVMVRLQ
jgi:hypothetical protein